MCHFQNTIAEEGNGNPPDLKPSSLKRLRALSWVFATLEMRRNEQDMLRYEGTAFSVKRYSSLVHSSIARDSFQGIRDLCRHDTEIWRRTFAKSHEVLGKENSKYLIFKLMLICWTVFLIAFGC